MTFNDNTGVGIYCLVWDVATVNRLCGLLQSTVFKVKKKKETNFILPPVSKLQQDTKWGRKQICLAPWAIYYLYHCA